jgi:hypothetical protein
VSSPFDVVCQALKGTGSVPFGEIGNKLATISAPVTAVLAIVVCAIGLWRESSIATPRLSMLLVAVPVTGGAMTRTGMTGGKMHPSQVRGTVIVT